MFWSDVSSNGIHRAWLNGTDASTIVSTGVSAAGNSFEWISTVC